MLEALYHKGPMPLGTIGSKLLVTGGNVTFVVKELEKGGWVKRQRSPDDGRVTLARLTRRGEALIARTFPSHALALTGAAQSLTAREQAQLARLLKKWGKAAQSV